MYVAKLGDVFMYIGSGKESRVDHVLSGKSHNSGLNELVAQGINLDVQIVLTNLSKEDARVEEQLLIEQHHPILNKAIAASGENKKLYNERKEAEKEMQNRKLSYSYLDEARLLYHIGRLLGDQDYIILSFALSRVDYNGIIYFTRKELDKFTDRHCTKVPDLECIDHMAFNIGNDIFYKGNVEYITANLTPCIVDSSLAVLRHKLDRVERLKDVLYLKSIAY